MIPERFAIKMVDELGFILRNNIIWEKPNGLPESVKDRFTKSTERIFFFVKNKQYCFKQLKEPIKDSTKQRRLRGMSNENKYAQYQTLSKPRPNIRGFKTKDGELSTGAQQYLGQDIKHSDLRKMRDVRLIPVGSFREAHFAVFPLQLPLQCIEAGCPVGGVVMDPFMGSGTTAIAALKLNCKYIGIEINKDYVEMAHKRIEKEAGLFICNGK